MDEEARQTASNGEEHAKEEIATTTSTTSTPDKKHPPPIFTMTSDDGGGGCTATSEEEEEEDDDDEGRARTDKSLLMMRQDSMASPAALEGTIAGFPHVADQVTHVPKSDDPFFSSSVTPAKGKYLGLIQSFLRQKEKDIEESMRKSLVDSICADALEVLKQEPSMLSLDIEEPDTYVVVGDVHGQFGDLISHVLSQQYDRPAGALDRKFLFLGDFVDRGPQGVEVMMLLLALKVEYPQHIYLLRGNHEEAQTSRIYGFLYEVRTKFNDLSVWASFNEVFCYFPLAALVSAPGHKFFAVHGGLSPSLNTVDEIVEIDRALYGGVLDNTSSDIVDGLLWSDPSDNTPRFMRNERGCGYLFGNAATAEFCQTNELDFVCRAHQMTMTGYCWTHGQTCLTVFSAPNYCGISGNMGAIMLVNHKWEMNFVQFKALPGSTQAPLPMSLPFGGGYFN